MKDQEISSRLQYDLSSLKDGGYDFVSIVCHDQPDPDCLASAMAVREIATHFGMKSIIYYGGEIAHTQNRVMINVLNIPLFRLDNGDDNDASLVADILSKSFIVVVDTSNFGKENCSCIKEYIDNERSPNLVIDHHTFSGSIQGDYIHRPYGSCSTILLEILRQLDIPISRTLATAIYLGITKDTDDLKAEGTSDNDRDAIEFIKKHIDLDMYLKILNYKKPQTLLELRRIAYNTMRYDNNLITANVGLVSPQQRALLADICDELLTIEGVETSVVLAVVNEGNNKKKFIEASFRSSALAMDANDFMQSVFGKKNAGGRKGAGGAKILLDINVSATIDHFISRDNTEGLECFIDALFDTYQSIIKNQKAQM